MPKLRFKISMSLDGFVAGPRQSVDNPLGIGGMRLHQWVFPLAVWRAMHGLQGGEVNESTRVVEESLANIGATVMGRNMFGGHPGPWDAETAWNGWWGVNPPFHHPVFVLTHYAREPLDGEPISRFWQDTYYPWGATNNLLEQPRYGISQDDPSITAPEQCRYDACAEVPPDFVASGNSFKTVIPGGKYAVLGFKGTGEQVGEAWTALLREWLPSSGLQLDARPCFEHYP